MSDHPHPHPHHKLGELTAYVYGEGTPEERAAFEAHTRDCPDCAADLERVRQQLPVAEAKLRQPPDTSVEGMMSLIERAEHDITVGRILIPERRVSPWLWAFTGAVLVLVMFATAIFMVRLQNAAHEVYVPPHIDGG
jgi:anti-sigma factor RsiW